MFFAGVTPFSSWNGILLSSNSMGAPADEPCPKKDGKTQIEPRSSSNPERKQDFGENMSFIGDSHDQVSPTQQVRSYALRRLGAYAT
jgi:hypothetical protein